MTLISAQIMTDVKYYFLDGVNVQIFPPPSLILAQQNIL